MHSHIRWLALSALIGAYAPLSAVKAQAVPARTARSASSALPIAEFASPSTLAPFKAGKRIFSVNESGALEVRDDEVTAPRTLFDAGSFRIVAPSPKGKYVAYGVAASGSAHDAAHGAATDSGSYEVRIRDVITGKDLPDVLHNARISPAPWAHDEKGFLYVRQDPSDGRERVYFHGIGRAEANDVMILSQFDHPEWRYAARVSDDGHYAVFTISYPADSHTRIYFIDLDNAGNPNFAAPVVKLAQTFDARYEFVDNAGSYFFLQTDRGAPLGRIVLANTDVIRESAWPSVIPQASDTLLYARTAGDEYLVAMYRSPSGANVARLYGPQNPAVLRKEVNARIDSMKKARKDDDDNNRSGRRPGLRELMGNGPAIRLEQRSDIPIPAGASIVAMNSVADDSQLFYTIKLSDGRTQSFTYDVKRSVSQPFPAAPASPPPGNSGN